MLPAFRSVFLKDNETMTAAFSMKKVKGTWLGYLAFDNSMVRYAQDRFVDVELIMADHTGLKYQNLQSPKRILCDLRRLSYTGW